MNTIIDRIVNIFDVRGDLAYGSEAVTQRQHALQSATLAEAENSPCELIVSALLHDIGHILDAEELPDSDDRDLDDAHEHRAYEWLLRHFGHCVADPVRLHVAAKRYLCTLEPTYEAKLSPTSHKSYLDQGGPMNATERSAFESEPHFENALRLRRWDDLAKDPQLETQPIEHFRGALEQCLHAESLTSQAVKAHLVTMKD
jgi:[1-hydroxy-2-(trimethylamino)ethyl]phosphonate dioxygenase